jgi:hypothetical protein
VQPPPSLLPPWRRLKNAFQRELSDPIPTTVLADLAEKIDPERLTKAARRENDLPSAQRLGFLLEHIGEKARVDPLAEWIKSFRTRTVYLRPGGSVRRARKSARWKVMLNEDVEVPE